jgi:hypothetical protein
MANERDFSFECIKTAMIVIHSLAILTFSILFIASIVILAESNMKSMGLSPEEKDTTRKFIHNNT